MHRRIAHIFFNVHMSNGHEGLMALIFKKRRTVKVKKGEYVIFINTAWTSVKIMVDGIFLAHYKHPDGKIAPETIVELPNFLNGTKIEYPRALRKVIYKMVP